jgi:hypothetical protein
MALVTGLICIICDAPFEALIVRKRPRFCSLECKAARVKAQRRRYKREKRYPNYPRKKLAKICLVCGEGFQTEAKDQKTCSRTCGGALGGRTTGPLLAAKARARNERPCLVCQRLFVPSNPSAKQRRAGYVQQTCGDRRCRRENAVARRQQQQAIDSPFLFDLFGPLGDGGEVR